MTMVPGNWYAVAAEHDVPAGHIYRTALGGNDQAIRELAIWRASDGAVQVWEDRCPHRGVRFSLGEVVGDELRCQYHAWRFAKGGACTFIPAQPDMKVPGSIHAKPWPVAVSAGLIWTGVDPVGEPPVLGEGAAIRAVPVARPLAEVETALAQADLPGLALTLQPLGDTETIVRGLVANGDCAAADRALAALRRQLECVA